MGAFVYMLRCADGSYYVGSARGEGLDRRLSEHHAGTYGGYTSRRRPVTLVHAEHFDHVTDAIAAERRIKGWSRAKKEALIRADRDALQWLAKRPAAQQHPSRKTPSS
ncbi:GIY-YIG nuclease family protein [Methylobacterium oryzae CBMB20]